MERKKIYIWGTGSTGKRIYGEVKDRYQVIGFLDNDESKWGTEFCGLPVIGNAEALEGLEYDEVVVCAIGAFESIRADLISCGVLEYKINGDFIRMEADARNAFLRNYAKVAKLGENISVAEGGVFQGDFSKKLMKRFRTTNFICLIRLKVLTAETL